MGNLVQKMYQEQHCKIWTLSDDRNEYERYSYLLEKPDSEGLSAANLSGQLLSRTATTLRANHFTVIVHDESNIRKEHSNEMEGLDFVKDLDGSLVPGYRTFNSIAIGDKNLHLLSCTPYSSEEENYDKTLPTESSFSSKSILKDQLQSISKAFKSENPDMVLIHLIDRGEDDNDIFDFISNTLEDKFAIRLKLNRNSDVQVWSEEKGKEIPLKIAKKTFANSFEQRYELFSWKGKSFKNAKAVIEYERFRFGKNWFNVVKIQLYDAGGRKIFKEPMLLISNIDIRGISEALRIFHLYLKRSKIEGVFKFLKSQLGWEEFQVRDLLAIKHIIILCYFIGAYFYELEPEITENEYMQSICKLGGGKGKVTRHFFLKGLEKIYHFEEVSRFFKEQNLSPNDIQVLMKKYT